jgi:cytochrome P450
LLYCDPPNHSHPRLLLSQALKPALLDNLGRRLQLMVEDLLQPAFDGQPFDVVNDLTFPLSLRVLCELIGFPLSDADAVRLHSLALTRAFGTRISEADRLLADAAVEWLRAYIGDLLDQRRSAQRPDVLSQIACAETTAQLSREDIVDNVAFLLFAGFDTTANLIANGIGALLAASAELRRLREDPGLIASGVEELLRYDPPIQGVARAVHEPVRFDGRLVREGRVLVLLIGSANRDERRFDNPDRLDVGRAPRGHLSFGGGIHRCLGALLARREMFAVLSRIVEKTSSLTAISPPVRRLDSRFRCFESMPVAISPS